MDETTDVVQGVPGGSCGSSPASRAASARRAARARPGSRRSSRASSTARPPDDLDLLLDVVRQHHPAPFPGDRAGLEPPSRKQTTICPLGPSAASPIASAIRALPRRVRGLRRDRRSPSIRGVVRPWRRSRCLTPQAARRDRASITVNGKEIEAEPGELVIDAAERNGIYIPRFCYHPRMKPVGMCRMCLVEIDTGRGPALQPSCMIPVAPDMKVDTESEVTKKAQDGVLEFLLINHPLDCPVCDKGGECPLQDQTIAYGPGESRFVEEKRHFEKPIPISDLVCLDRERCILCDRCTRFAKEVAGDPLIHFLDRGNQTEVNTFPDQPFARYFSGNTVQICPVGALTATPYRFKARPWDLDQVESTCTTCSVGCRTLVQSSRNEVLRYQGVDVDPVNWGWLCDKGRFGFEAVNSDDRLGEPARPRRATSSRAVPWGEALAAAAAALAGGQRRTGIAVLGGARLTNESAYAWAKLAKGVIGTDNVDAQLGDGLPAEVVLGLPRATIDEVCAPGGTVLLLGPDLKEELPVLFLRLRHAVARDGVTRRRAGHPAHVGRPTWPTATLRHRPGEAGEVVRALLAGAATQEVGGVEPDAIATAGALLADGPVTVVLGPRQPGRVGRRASSPPPPRSTRPIPHVRFLSALRRGNVHGALDMGLAPGLLPGRTSLDDGGALVRARTAGPRCPTERGLDAAGILQAAADGKIDVLVLLGADPLADFPDRDLAAAGARRCPHRHRRRPLPHRLGPAGRRRARRRRFRRGRRHHHQPRGPGQHRRPQGHAAGHRPRRLDDRRRAGPPARRRPRPRVGRARSGTRSPPSPRATPASASTRSRRRDGVVVGRSPSPRSAAPPIRRAWCSTPTRRRRGPTPASTRTPRAADAADAADTADEQQAAEAEATEAQARPRPEAGRAEPRPPSPPVLAAARADVRAAGRRPTRRRSTPTRCGSSPPASSTTRARSCSTRPASPGSPATPCSRLHPHDFDRLGVAAGDVVTVTSSKGSVSLPVAARRRGRARRGVRSPCCQPGATVGALDRRHRAGHRGPGGEARDAFDPRPRPAPRRRHRPRGRADRPPQGRRRRSCCCSSRCC